MNDETGGTTSYEIDISIAGRSFVIGNIVQQSATTQNRAMLAYGIESNRHPNQELYVVNNTFVSERSAGATFIFMGSGISYPALLQNNIFAGVGTSNVITTQSNATNTANCTASDPKFLNRLSHDYSLQSGSPCAEIGVTPGFAGSVDLAPADEYQHRVGGRQRMKVGRIDAGAIER